MAKRHNTIFGAYLRPGLAAGPGLRPSDRWVTANYRWAWRRPNACSVPSDAVMYTLPSATTGVVVRHTSVPVDAL